MQKLYEKLMFLYVQRDKSSRVHITWEKLHVFTTTLGRNCSQLFQARRGKKFVEWKYVERDISPQGISNRARNKGGTPSVHLLSFLRFHSFATPSCPPLLPSSQATNHRLAHILFSLRTLPSVPRSSKKKNPKEKPLLVYPRTNVSHAPQCNVRRRMTCGGCRKYLHAIVFLITCLNTNFRESA